jgi:hypothetical protein
MREDWTRLVDSLLRPVRPRLDECRGEAERVAADLAGKRARALADCEVRIESLRAQVFAAKDGVVTAQMTALEREWRRLSRGDRDGELMQVWSRIAPARWVDQKRWRDAPQLETAVLLASDPDGVELAEETLMKSRPSRPPPRIRWRPLGADFEGMPALIGGSVLDDGIHDAVLARFPDRPHLARAIAIAARANARRYFDIWRAGYVLGGEDTLEFPTS